MSLGRVLEAVFVFEEVAAEVVLLRLELLASCLTALLLVEVNIRNILERRATVLITALDWPRTCVEVIVRIAGFMLSLVWVRVARVSKRLARAWLPGIRALQAF